MTSSLAIRIKLLSAASWPVPDVANARIDAAHRERLALLALGTATHEQLLAAGARNAALYSLHATAYAG